MKISENDVRKRIARDRDWIYVWRPDHPLLFTNPDYFLASAGKLVVGFVPSAEEAQSPRLLLNRVAISRLALPQQTFFVIERADSLNSASDTSGLVEQLRRSVDAMILGTRDEFSGILRNPRMPVDNSSAKLRKRWFSGYHQRLEAVRNASLGSQLPAMNSSQLFSRAQSRHPRSRLTPSVVLENIFELDCRALITSSNKNTSKALRQIFTSTMNYGSSIDNGLAHFLDIDLVATLPRSRAKKSYDPLWAERVLAFAGVLAIPENDEDTINQAFHYLERVKK